jgi:hypothetical protein
MAGLNNQVHGELDLRIGRALSGGPGKRRAHIFPATAASTRDERPSDSELVASAFSFAWQGWGAGKPKNDSTPVFESAKRPTRSMSASLLKQLNCCAASK